MQTKQRRDCGEIWLTERDLTVLRWMGEQYAVRLDTLGLLLGRAAQQPTQAPGCVARSTVRRVIARWRRAGLVDTRKFFYGEPAWIWLTTQGLRQLDFGYRACTPKAGLLDHLHMVNQVRLRVEANYTEAADWRSERFLRREYGRNRRTHIPDAEIITTQAAVIGVEVELTQKSRRRVQEIVHKLVHRYDCIWFFVNHLTRSTVTAATQVQPNRFRLYDVEQVVT